MNRLKTTLGELYDAVLRMSRNDIKNALDKLSETCKISGKKLFQSVTNEKEYSVLKESVYLMQSTVLYYFAGAVERQKQGDDLSLLVCLTYAAGINSILGATFLPILRRNAYSYNAEKEISNIQKINTYIEQQISSLTHDTVRRISGKEQNQIERRLSETVQTMLISATKVDPEVRNLAVTMSKKFVAGDFKQARRLYEYVRDEITYIHDPVGIEEIQSPKMTLKLGAGDCDDKAVLLAALLKSIGFETCFFIADTDNDNYPDHVYTGVYLPEAPELYKPLQKKLLNDGKDLHEWIPLDPTYEDSDFGVIPLVDIGILQYVPIIAK